jgi:hypothetical protein
MLWRRQGNSTRAALTKCALQQLVANPVAYVPSFYVINGICQGQSPEQIVSKGRDEFAGVMFRVWATWVPSSLFQFLVVPDRYHVLWVSAVGFGWNMALSLFYNEDAHASHGQD